MGWDGMGWGGMGWDGMVDYEQNDLNSMRLMNATNKAFWYSRRRRRR
jgi:hypothetical protein